MGFSRNFLVAASVIALAACQTTKDERLVFAKSNLSMTAYETDVTTCDAYLEEKGASDGEMGGATAIGFLFGGIMGAAAAHSAHENSNQRLMDECMYRQGYRKLQLPENLPYGDETKGQTTQYNRMVATKTLVEKQEMDELISWNNAIRVPGVKGIQEYLEEYPDGLFAQEAKRKLVE